MKPWEEEWKVVGQKPPGETVTYGPWLIIDGRGARVGTVGDGCSEAHHARLVAAAPEMARLLLEAQYTPTGYDHMPCCPWCGMPENCDRTVWPTGHQTDCGFVAVLRKAGVIE